MKGHSGVRTNVLYTIKKERKDAKNWEGPNILSYIPWRTKDLAVDIFVAKGTNKKNALN